MWKDFFYKPDLKKHERRMHEEDTKKHECEHCSNLFTSISNLTKHIAVVHEKIEKFKCNRCEKKFAANENLKLHIETIHEMIKNSTVNLVRKHYLPKAICRDIMKMFI